MEDSSKHILEIKKLNLKREFRRLLGWPTKGCRWLWRYAQALAMGASSGRDGMRAGNAVGTVTRCSGCVAWILVSREQLRVAWVLVAQE